MNQNMILLMIYSHSLTEIFLEIESLNDLERASAF